MAPFGAVPHRDVVGCVSSLYAIPRTKTQPKHFRVACRLIEGDKLPRVPQGVFWGSPTTGRGWCVSNLYTIPRIKMLLKHFGVACCLIKNKVTFSFKKF